MITKERLPQAVGDYISDHFREDFLFELKKSYVVKGRKFYQVEISKDDLVHTLTFDEKGAKVDEQVDAAFPSDPREGGEVDIPQ